MPKCRKFGKNCKKLENFTILGKILEKPADKIFWGNLVTVPTWGTGLVHFHAWNTCVKMYQLISYTQQYKGSGKYTAAFLCCLTTVLLCSNYDAHWPNLGKIASDKNLVIWNALKCHNWFQIWQKKKNCCFDLLRIFHRKLRLV